MVTMSGPLLTSFSTSRRTLRRSTSRFFSTLAPTPRAFLDQAEQDVLRADVFVVEALGLLVGQRHDLAGPIREPFKHVHLLSAGASGRPLIHSRIANRTLTTVVTASTARRVLAGQPILDPILG